MELDQIKAGAIIRQNELSDDLGNLTIECSNIQYAEVSNSLGQKHKLTILELINGFTLIKPAPKCQSEMPTEDELLDAGFRARANCFAINTVSGINIEVEPCLTKGSIKDRQGCLIKEIECTKLEISKSFEFFEGHPLDFTPKEKKYDWESVGERMDPDYLFKNLSTLIDRISSFPDGIFSKKLIATLKLAYIIAEIDRDFKEEEGKSKVWYFSKEEGYDSIQIDSTYHLKTHAVFTKTSKGAVTLLKYNEQLIKDALEIK